MHYMVVMAHFRLSHIRQIRTTCDSHTEFRLEQFFENSNEVYQEGDNTTPYTQ